MAAPNIKSFSRIIPMMYAYNTPDIPYHEGWTKIGYTEKQSVEDRINQQTHTANIRWTLAWKDNAMYKDGSGEYFNDHAFHNFLQRRENITREPKTEWFKIEGEHSQILFNRFANRVLVSNTQECEYTLRSEQAQAVGMTKAYFENGGEEFLWNAKPRFGKTLASYDLVRTMGFKKVLIVTNRPSIANSWADDFGKFIAWRNELCFVSDTEALSNHPVVLSREEFRNTDLRTKGMVAFESLQGLKGSKHFGNYNGIDKLEWMSKIEFDLLIIDESQEGVDTYRTERAFRYIKRKHTLYLSGTPFKQLASDQFSDEQIFNWSYADEQEAKENFDGDGYNPYESLPKLCMYTYQLGNMIYDELSRGVDLSDDETADFAFDLNEFFLTNDKGKFIHEDDVKKFLRSLFTNEKYPFSTPELRRELSHTMWYLNRVASAKALKKMMDSEEFEELFGEYEIVIAAGDGKISDEDKANVKALDRVRTAIAENDKTITLTVGQLTVGITVPEWSGVLMLCNMKSPSSYMQAAFRAQNPCKLTAPDGKRYMKENAYIFDFDPARTLIIYDEFANNLSKSTVDGRGTTEDREGNIKRLLNFFPVLGEDEEGKMVELDPVQVLTIPRKIKSQEVVRRGFLSNFLFQNISNIFSAPLEVKAIVEKLVPANEDPKRNQRKSLENIDDIPVDDKGNVAVPNEIVIGKTQDIFGDKIYEDMSAEVEKVLSNAISDTTEDTTHKVDEVIDKVVDTVKAHVFEPVSEEYEIKKSTKTSLENDVEREIKAKFEKIKEVHKEAKNIAQIEYQNALKDAKSDEDVKKAEEAYQADITNLLQTFNQAVTTEVQETIKNKPKEIVERLETKKKEEEKRSVEDDVRAHLRGFSRTIPSFIMAYGDENLTLANFDDYTEDDVFLEVTGITEDDFRFLRDGGDYVNEETGETEHFDGNLFDEVVFNDSIQEFLKKREQLANYFDETLTEDIFDYIPPQKTNQIFTPKWVVSKMVDELEINNPGCFDNPDFSFADLYMKSGLYITEIVKRLYKSEGLKKAFPDGKERIRHILSKQVYGMAPTRIIYLIATNYILGFDPKIKEATNNFVQADAAEASKNNTLQELVDECFGK